MIDNRIDKRFRKRLSLRYGIDAATKVGFTEDISDTGIFVRSPVVLPPNTILIVDLRTTSNEIIQLKGRVMWAKKVPQNMMHRIKGGMGLLITEFLSGEELYQELCEERSKR